MARRFGRLSPLYQYERVTDLTLKMNKTSLNLYEGDTAQLTVKVKPSTFTGGVTWAAAMKRLQLWMPMVL